MRDCLASDWSEYLNKIFPDALWQMILNEGEKAVERIEKHGINAVILTGGNNLGEYPHKDKTDLSLKEYPLPLIGMDIDVLYDCAIRSDLLVEFISAYKKRYTQQRS